MIKLAISGAQGRMGQAISRLAFEGQDFDVTALIERSEHKNIGKDINGITITSDNNVFTQCDVLIEFTLPEGTMTNLEACVANKTKMVIGTTGFTDDQIKKIEEASKEIPIVFSTNMSIGVNILFKLIELTSKKIGTNTMSINETHHVHKKDAPSGTAKTMAEIAQKGSGQTVSNIESFREGEVIGDHDITFETPEDTLTISHHAKNRDMFAKGALTAAKFLQDKQSGLYHMQDVLGLSSIQIN